jgi:hypothetical protein
MTCFDITRFRQLGVAALTTALLLISHSMQAGDLGLLLGVGF